MTTLRGVNTILRRINAVTYNTQLRSHTLPACFRANKTLQNSVTQFRTIHYRLAITQSHILSHLRDKISTMCFKCNYSGIIILESVNSAVTMYLHCDMISCYRSKTCILSIDEQIIINEPSSFEITTISYFSSFALLRSELIKKVNPLTVGR